MKELFLLFLGFCGGSAFTLVFVWIYLRREL